MDKTNAVAVDVADNSTQVSGPARLYGVYINTTLSAHDLPIKNGNVTLVTIPASAAAGTFFNFPGLLFNQSMVVDPNDIATGNVTIALTPV